MTQEPESKPSLEVQITDIVLKTIKTGGIAGVGIGAFWQLFIYPLQEDPRFTDGMNCSRNTHSYKQSYIRSAIM